MTFPHLKTGREYGTIKKTKKMKPDIRPATTPVGMNGSHFSVFVVDDDESFLFALAFHLKKDTGCKVYCYTSVEECLCHLNHNPDVIILDYYFDREGENNIDGMTALQLIKSVKSKIPVIMISAQHDIEVSMELLKAGAFTYIIKDHEALKTIEKTLLSLRSLLAAQQSH